MSEQSEFYTSSRLFPIHSFPVCPTYSDLVKMHEAAFLKSHIETFTYFQLNKINVMYGCEQYFRIIHNQNTDKSVDFKINKVGNIFGIPVTGIIKSDSIKTKFYSIWDIGSFLNIFNKGYGDFKLIQHNKYFAEVDRFTLDGEAIYTTNNKRRTHSLMCGKNDDSQWMIRYSFSSWMFTSILFASQLKIEPDENYIFDRNIWLDTSLYCQLSDYWSLWWIYKFDHEDIKKLLHLNFDHLSYGSLHFKIRFNPQENFLWGAEFNGIKPQLSLDEIMYFVQTKYKSVDIGLYVNPLAYRMLVLSHKYSNFNLVAKIGQSEEKDHMIAQYGFGIEYDYM